MAEAPQADESAATERPDTNGEFFRDVMEKFDAAVPLLLQMDRAEMLQDRRFASISGAQWEGSWAAQFDNSVMVEVNKVAAGLEKIDNDYRKNRVTVNFRAVGKKASEETANLLDGLFRADVYASKGGQAFDNAFGEGTGGGIGAWRLANVWDDPLDPENDDQRIGFLTIPDADQSVFWDPNSKLYDKSDAAFCFVISSVSPGAYRKEYGDDPVDWPSPLPFYFGDFQWFTPDAVKVAEFYQVEDKGGRLEVYRNRLTDEERREWTTDLDEKTRLDMDLEGWTLSRVRSAKRRRVMKSVLSGGGVLRPPKKIAGTMIPVVPFYGKRWYIDNMERARGAVRLGKDPQRIYNSAVSRLQETNSLAPLERPIVTAAQIAGHEQTWADMNINRSPYVTINDTYNADGTVATAGPIGTISPPQVAPVTAALLQIANSDVLQVTNAEDGADQAMSNVSADAMDLAATRTDDKAGVYMDNFKQSMQRCGEIYADMARDVYFQEGRIVEVMNDEGEHGEETLVEGVADPKTGAYRVRHDLSKGRYKVISDVTEQTATLRDKTVRRLSTAAQVIAPFDPEGASVMMSAAVVNMDGEGMSEVQEFFRKRLVQMGVSKPTPEDEEEAQNAAQNAKPDPQAEYLTAAAEKSRAEASESESQIRLNDAKTAESMAKADKDHAEAKVGIVERVRNMFAPKPPGDRQ